jgi:hypothetical protein
MQTLAGFFKKLKDKKFSSLFFLSRNNLEQKYY